MQMKVAVIYYSRHRENTKKLLEAISGEYEVTLLDAVRFFGCLVSQ